MRTKGVGAILGCAVATAAAIVGCSEWMHWRATRRYLGTRPQTGQGTHALVVLGFPTRADGSLHPLQRWRCRIAARSMTPGALVVFTGGAVKSRWVEADVMARYAHERLGIPAESIRTEAEAESTWQNIEFTIPLIENAERITIVSSPMHAARARRYLHLQRPDLAARLTPAADYRPFEAWWLKMPTAAHEFAAIVRRNVGRMVVRALGELDLRRTE
ncbi:YdcF family protein [Nocardia vaccinii]|uniref:YdcF family protein n=1 Tax=Nocardia vaccinii TaxID=1822 RepID=UPI000836FB3F|nr:YdcF family protein [Nocardia vaccinii]